MYASIGIISSGTLVPHEVAGDLAHHLESLARRDGDTARKRSVRRALVSLGTAAADDEAALQHFIDEVAPSLFETYCPPYAAYRAGDGGDAAFGIVPELARLEEDARAGDDVVKVNAGDRWPSPCPFSYVMVVSDHGNVSLCAARTRKELWSCV